MAAPEKLTLKQLLASAQLQADIDSVTQLSKPVSDDGELLEPAPTLAQVFDWENKPLKELDDQQWRLIEFGRDYLTSRDRYKILLYARAYAALTAAILVVSLISPEFRSSVSTHRELSLLVIGLLTLINTFFYIFGDLYHGNDLVGNLFISNDRERIKDTQELLEMLFEQSEIDTASDYSFERAVKMIEVKAEWNGPIKKNQMSQNSKKLHE